MAGSAFAGDGVLRHGGLKAVDLSRLRGESLAAMLYGSQARGNPRPDSDIDIIQVVSGEPYAYSVGRVNVAQYRPVTLRRMAEAGSLFIFHLKQEGQILSDPLSILADCLAAYRAPSDYAQMLSDICLAARALDIERESSENIVGLCRLGVYLLRTTLYIKAAQNGIDSFDIQKVLDVLGDEDVARAMRLRSRPAEEMRASDVSELRQQLESVLGCELANGYGSLEALAVASADNPRVLPLFENLLLGGAAVTYSALTLPPF